MSLQGLTIGNYTNILPIQEDDYTFEWDLTLQAKNEQEFRKYCNVLKGQDKNGNPVLIKQINIELLQKNKGFEAELNMMKQFKSDNIIQIYDIFSLPKNRPPQLYIFEEFCPNSLNNYIYKQNKGKLTENQAIQILSGLTQGLKDFIQFEKRKAEEIVLQDDMPQIIVYNSLLDIKPRNIMIDSKGNVKLATNFGIQSAVVGVIKKPLNGTPIYKSPQVIMNELGYENIAFSDKSDVWSLGMVFYQTLFGKMPWSCREISSYLVNINKYGLKFPYERYIGKNTKNFIEKCLELEEEDRLSWDQVFNHPLFYEGPGEIIKERKFNLQADGIKVMREMQQIIEIRDINIQDFFKQADLNKDDQLNLKEFYYMTIQLDPRVTYFEATSMFNQITVTGDSIFISDIEEILLKYDFSDLEDFGGSILQDIKQIIKVKSFQIESIFHSESSFGVNSTIKSKRPNNAYNNTEMMVSKFLDKKNYLDKIAFRDLVGYLAPGLRSFEISILFNKVSF